MSQLRLAWPRISAEFERARRYERSVTVAVFSAPGSSTAAKGAKATGGNGNGNGNGHALRASLDGLMAGVLAGVTREIDLVTCHAGCCLVVMPEIGTDDGGKAVRRMREVCAARLGTPIEAGIAVFPADGWVFLDLVEVARKNARNADGQAAPAGGHVESLPAEGMSAPLGIEPAQGT